MEKCNSKKGERHQAFILQGLMRTARQTWAAKPASFNLSPRGRRLEPAFDLLVPSTVSTVPNGFVSDQDSGWGTGRLVHMVL